MDQSLALDVDEDRNRLDGSGKDHSGLNERALAGQAISGKLTGNRRSPDIEAGFEVGALGQGTKSGELPDARSDLAIGKTDGERSLDRGNQRIDASIGLGNFGSLEERVE